MKCWVCKRQARGYGHTDTRWGVGDPRRYPPDWVFCSRRCQEAFHALYGNWLSFTKGYLRPEEVSMVDPSEIERAAMNGCLKAFGEVGGEIGFGKPLGDYSEAEALQVIEAIVTAYSEAMTAHHEATRLPPLRDPKRPAGPAGPALIDFDDEIPF